MREFPRSRSAFALVGPTWLKDATKRFDQWRSRAKKVEEEEAKLHESLDPAVEGIVKEKKIILFKEMLTLIGYPNVKVAELIAQGFPLVGTLDATGAFEKRPPDEVVHGADVRWLNRTAREAQDNIIRNFFSSPVRTSPVKNS